MIKYLIEKEFKQLFRHPFLPKLVFIFPCMIMFLMPWAMNQEIKNINLSVVDNDHSIVSRRLVDKLSTSTYFHITSLPASYEEGMEHIEMGTADIILEIPRYLERDFTNGKAAHVLIAANAVNGTKGGLGSSYLTSIIGSYSEELRAEHPSGGSVALQEGASVAAIPQISITTQNFFNPNLNYKLFMIPALMGMILTLLCGFLPALNIVSEKEVGTIEQINVTPVGKFTFILAKLIPYWVIGFVALTICLLLAWIIYGIVSVGSLVLVYFFAILFVLTMSGIGLVISNYSATMQQAMFVMFFCLLLFILTSGLFTPIASMPGWAQVITWFNPLRYFMEVMRMVFLKGSTLGQLLPQLSVLVLFVLIINSWAVWSYKKKQ